MKLLADGVGWRHLHVLGETIEAVGDREVFRDVAFVQDIVSDQKDYTNTVRTTRSVSLSFKSAKIKKKNKMT